MITVNIRTRLFCLWIEAVNKNKSIEVKKKNKNMFENLKISIRINYRKDKKDNSSTLIESSVHLVLKLFEIQSNFAPWIF